jgi:hypothetical protein
VGDHRGCNPRRVTPPRTPRGGERRPTFYSRPALPPYGLSAEALADIERLDIELAEGTSLTVCDHDGTEDQPTWLVVRGVAHFDAEREAWQIAYKIDDCSWEPRTA